MNFCVIISLIESAYQRFKYEFPDEEPFFRITCTRRYGRANRTRVWRPADREMRVVDGNGKPTFLENSGSGEILLDNSTLMKKKQAQAFKESQQEVKPLGGKRHEVRPTKVIDKDIETIKTTKVGFDACVDVRLDDPLTVNVFQYCLDKTNYILQELRAEYKVFLEDPMLNCKGTVVTTELTSDVESLEKRIDMIVLARERQKQLEDEFRKIEDLRESQSNPVMEKLVEDVKTAFKESTTVQEVVGKYIAVQRKLNDLKAKVVPLMKLYNEEPFIDKINSQGFLATVWEFIDYLHMNTRDDYADDVMTLEDLEIQRRIDEKKLQKLKEQNLK